MLFAITLTYRQPKGEIDNHLDAHRSWLLDHTRAGSILAAGPLEPPTGGLILAQGESRAAAEALMTTDPFVVHGLVDVTVLACAPALRHADFPQGWAATAKPITPA